MAVDDSDDSSAGALSVAALRVMAARGIAPTPQNYAIWYLYSSGGDPRLTEAVDLVIEEAVGFSDKLSQTLFESFCIAEELRPILARKSEALSSTVSDALVSLGAAGSNVASYDRALGSFEAEVSNAQSDPRAAVSMLVQKTRKMRQENARLQTELARATSEVTTMKLSLADVTKESRTDTLTRLGNRKAFEESLFASTRDFVASSKPFVLIMIDIDHFKCFNDVHGHQAGDDALKLVASILAISVRSGDAVARYGGEEFAVVLPATTLNAGRTVAEKVRLAVEKRRITRRGTGEDIGNVTLSLGVAEVAEGESTETLIGRADAALYVAKRTGRNRVCLAQAYTQPRPRRSMKAEVPS